MDRRVLFAELVHNGIKTFLKFELIIYYNLHILGLRPHYFRPLGMGTGRFQSYLEVFFQFQLHVRKDTLSIVFGRTLFMYCVRKDTLCSEGHIALGSEGHFSEYEK